MKVMLIKDVVNVGDEQLKFHAIGTTPPQEPSGMLVYHNTFVSPGLALNLQTSATSHHFAIANNLFVGPSPPGPRVADWSAPIDDGSLDHDGWFPNGTFDFDAAGRWTSFAAMQRAGALEAHGVLLAPPIFASGLVPPASFRTTMAPADVAKWIDAAAKDLRDRMGVVRPPVQMALDKMSAVPVDIEPRFTTADQLVAETLKRQ